MENAVNSTAGKVLILEDDFYLAALAEEAVESLGYIPVVASNCADAMKVIGGEMPRAALLDFELPDGTSAAIAKLFEGTIPYRVVSGVPRETIVAAGLDPRRYRPKPLDYAAALSDLLPAG